MPATKRLRNFAQNVDPALVRFNSTKGAEKAFQSCLKSGKKEGVEREDRKAIGFWDGEDLPELHLTADGRWLVKADSMEGVEKDLKQTDTHLQILRGATPELARLMDNPDDKKAVAMLKEANIQIEKENKANHFPEDMLDSYKIKIKEFQAMLREAKPVVDRLRKNLDDSEARLKFDTLNERLRDFNQLHQYPSEWTMNLPTQSAPERTVGANEKPHSEVPSAMTEVPDKPCFRRCIRRPGYVLDDGIDKKIEGSLRVGYGHQMLISHPGRNNLTIFEKVAASTFGKGFGKAYTARPDAKSITMGSVQDLEHEKFEEMVIAGVASDRRDPGKEPAVGWAQEAKTIVRVGFGTNPDKFIWYPY
ncbi:hypothetical protein RBB50_012177 [Rhinocladiella similis]